LIISLSLYLSISLFSLYFLSKMTLFLSKVALFLSKATLFVSKMTLFLSKTTHFLSKVTPGESDAQFVDVA